MIWRLLAVALFGFASISGPLAATSAALLGAGLLALSYRRPDLDVSPAVTRAVVAVLTLALVAMGTRLGSFAFPEPAGPITAIWIVGAVAAAVLVAWPRAQIRIAAPVLAVALVLIVAAGTVVQYHGNLFGLDVYRMHEAAADALLAGDNPYTDAVRVEDGSPNAAEGAVLEGYSYPPVTLILFSLGDWLGGDPRWASVAAIVVGLGLAVRMSGLKGAAPLVVVILAASPTLRWIVWSGATEPLSFALLVAAAATWRRPTLSAVILGLALATKQYMVMVVPLLFLIDERPWRRSLIASGVAGSTLLPALLADPRAFWHALFERPLGLGFRPDTASISGALDRFGWRVDVPSVVMVVIVVAVGFLFARNLPAEPASALLGGGALVLAVTFLLTLAFTNYWWLVQWLTAGAALVSVAEREADPDAGKLSPATVA